MILRQPNLIAPQFSNLQKPSDGSMWAWRWASMSPGDESPETYQGMPNQALEQTRDSVLRYGEVVGCELLNFFVLS